MKMILSLRKISILSLTILLLSLTACSGLNMQASYRYQIPENTGDGWQTASLGDVGMQTQRMVTFMDALAEYPDHWVHSVVIIKDGKLVFETYFPGQDLDLSDLGGELGYSTKDFDRDTLHCAASVSKSITAVVFGIAIDQGLIPGTEETLFSFFPDYEHLNNPTKNQITLEHLLKMGSGFPWTEAYDYTDPRNDLTSMIGSDDPIAYILSKDVIEEPGTRFIYNSGTTNLLGEIIHRASGMTLSSYAEQVLFAPLNIDTYEWYPFPSMPQMTVASSTLYLRPRDMAKIGQMYLDGGTWHGNRIVSEDWVSQSTRQAIGMDPSTSPVSNLDTSYGYQWWLGTFATGQTATYFAAGYGGQFIFVLPEPQMVVIFTAGGFEDGNYDALLQIMNEYILPAAGIAN